MGRHAFFGRPCSYRASGTLNHARNPTLYLRLVGKVRRSKVRFQTRLILEHAAVKPHSVKSQERKLAASPAMKIKCPRYTGLRVYR